MEEGRGEQVERGGREELEGRKEEGNAAAGLGWVEVGRGGGELEVAAAVGP